jgi:hypothetical protein
MTGGEQPAGPSVPDRTGSHLVLGAGSVVALTMSGLALGALALAMTALPNDVPYPFTSDVIATQWPGDYLWMYPAMVLMLLFIAFIVSVHEYAPPTRKIFSLLGLCLSVIAAAVLLVTYFIQVTVMQPSLEKGQLDGWAILTMYNPNGVFIALEELGYLLMSLALFCLAPVFTGPNKVERAIRWLLVLSLAATVASLAGVSAARGIDRGDAFEILVISIVWLTLIVAGPLVAVVLRRAAAQPPLVDPRTNELRVIESKGSTED